MNHSCGAYFYQGSCPYNRLRELNRMCGCAPGVLAQNISACDCFCRQSCCGCEQTCGCQSSRGCGC